MIFSGFFLRLFSLTAPKKQLAPIEVTVELCKQYRNFLPDRYHGDTPMNYFSEFKRMVKAATIQGYFRWNPPEDVKAIPSKKELL